MTARVPYKIRGHFYWTCQCGCGRRRNIQHSHLVSGKSRSCRHLVEEYHATLREMGRKKSNAHRRRLTESEVHDIRELWGSKQATQAELATRFKVSKLTIFNIVHRKSWAKLKERNA